MAEFRKCRDAQCPHTGRHGHVVGHVVRTKDPKDVIAAVILEKRGWSAYGQAVEIVAALSRAGFVIAEVNPTPEVKD